ncbi:competence protein CoiA family protein [Enterobacter huaxiensis]|uniref:DUF7830 domain-containing protein n=1 Tax=Enterobacter huaxiensis TaxID=2494702 RepID=UPI0035C115F7
MILARYKGRTVLAISSAKRKKPFYCVLCNGAVILRRSTKGNLHFAHLRVSPDCPNGSKYGK